MLPCRMKEWDWGRRSPGSLLPALEPGVAGEGELEDVCSRNGHWLAVKSGGLRKQNRF